MKSFPPPIEEDNEAPDSSLLHVPMEASPITKTATPSGRSTTSSLSQTPKSSSLASQSQSQKKTPLTPRALSLGSQSTGSPYSQNTQSPTVSKEGKVKG